MWQELPKNTIYIVLRDVTSDDSKKRPLMINFLEESTLGQVLQVTPQTAFLLPPFWGANLMSRSKSITKTK